MRRLSIILFLIIIATTFGHKNQGQKLIKVAPPVVLAMEELKKDIVPQPSPIIIPPHTTIYGHDIKIIKEKRLYVNIIATAYTGDAYENGGYGGTTASGKQLSRGMVATPTSIPFGTKIVIDGMGDFVAEDRGHPSYIKWMGSDTVRIDIYIPSKSQAKEFGVKHLKGYIVIK